MSDSRPIGVFDSGIGGLTVVKNIAKLIPNENVIYFGDIARIPYGTKSQETIQKFAAQTVKFLVEQDVKVIIIACNTISAIAKDIVIEVAGNIPVIDVITAGVNSVKEFVNVGVIATPATVRSQAYPNKINECNLDINVSSQPCGLFVPMIEEGFISGEIVELVSKEYLSFFSDKKLDALVLGCTHYPIIEKSISRAICGITLIDPSLEATKMLVELLNVNSILNVEMESPIYKFYVTDIPIKFKQIGEVFLETQMECLEIVDIDNY
jgi:glutamate racemase